MRRASDQYHAFPLETKKYILHILNRNTVTLSFPKTCHRNGAWVLHMGMPGWHEGSQGRINRHIADGRCRGHHFLVRPVLLGVPGIPFPQRVRVSVTSNRRSTSLFSFFFFVLPLLLFLFYTRSVTGAMGICFPYLGEFQPTKYRERCLCWMEMFWTVGVIVLPREYCVQITIIPSAVLGDALSEHWNHRHSACNAVLHEVSGNSK